MSLVDAILIAGPTASGKSALAIRLAQALDGIVVNADSMQVYGDLRVITARPSEAELAGAPHRLYGHVDGATNYSVGRYLADAIPVLDALRLAGRVAIVTGGTGLYVKALTAGLSEMPSVPDEIRAAVRLRAEGRASADLHAELAARDPVTAAGLRPSDRLRVLRALEILAATGRPLAAFRERRNPGPLAEMRRVEVFLTPDRETLRARIDRRFDAMIAEGALEEVAALASRGLDPALPVMRAHGVPALLAHLRGEIPLADAIRAGQGDTRRYVKRQFTWARHQAAHMTCLSPETAYEDTLRLVAAAPGLPQQQRHEGRGRDGDERLRQP